MSYFSNLSIEIQELCADGATAQEISAATGVPIELVEAEIKSIEDEDYGYDDSMDGDFDSGMASAGFGTDEDYNHYEYDE